MRSGLFRRFFLAAFLALIGVSLPTVSEASRRVALVIGNGGYAHVPALPNPTNDAVAMSTLLKSLGFEVFSGTDLNRDAMHQEIKQFAVQTRDADVALFFYAGHGLQLDGKNYLVPVDADLKDEVDVKMGAPIDMEIMINQAMAEAKVKLIFLDACRDNPFVKQLARSMRKTRAVALSNGLAEMRPTEGTLIAFATGPGQVALDGDGRHSPFTSALLENLATPGAEISQTMTRVRAAVNDTTRKQQLPWQNTNLTGEFYMIPPAPGAAPAGAVATAAPGAAPSDLEMEYWRSVSANNKPEELRAYLSAYPAGAFAPLARMRLASVDAVKHVPEVKKDEPAAVVVPQASRETEDALDLGRSDRKEVQQKLTALGYGTRSIDGHFKEPTRKAIANWQTARGYAATGYFNKPQYDALMSESAPRSVAKEQPKRQQHRSAAQQQRPNSNNNGGGNDAAAAAAAGFIGGIAGGLIGSRFGR